MFHAMSPHRQIPASGIASRWWGIRSAVVAAALLGLVLTAGCADRQRRNPLDPLATGAAVIPTPLDAVAGDDQVLLTWDFTLFHDIEGLRLIRQGGASNAVLVRELASDATEFLDEEVDNGVTYTYELVLVVGGEGERLLQPSQKAAPGPETGWVADRDTGLVRRLSPDARRDVLARGRFSSLAGMAINRADGSCWVSDKRAPGLYRISKEGDLVFLEAGLVAPGDLSIDSDSGLGWIADTDRRRVHVFGIPTDADPLVLHEVDASFEEPFSVAAAGKSCWITDREAGRVLLFNDNGARAAEWRDLVRPGMVASAAIDEEALIGWVLVSDGDGLARLEVDAGVVDIALPFRGAVSVGVDEVSGDCWVMSASDMAVFDSGGMFLSAFDGIPGGRHLAVDGANRQLWIVGSTVAWKMSMDRLSLVQLEGFSTPFRVAVDPGR